MVPWYAGRAERWIRSQAQCSDFSLDLAKRERFGKEASEFIRRMVEGKRVRLEFDPANAAQGRNDNTQQRRTLAYVFLADGMLLNAEIIREGATGYRQSTELPTGRKPASRPPLSPFWVSCRLLRPMIGPCAK